MGIAIEAVRLEDLKEGDIILVRHRVKRLRLDLGLAITFIEGFTSGMIQGAPVPRPAIAGRERRIP